MQISFKHVLLEKAQDEVRDGFQTVEPTDSFIYKGKVIGLPSVPVYVSDRHLLLGDIVLFAKYSPDTIELDLEDHKVKFVRIEDLLAVL